MRVLSILIFVLFVSSNTFADEPWITAAGGYSTFGLDSISDAPTTYNGFELEPGSMSGGRSLRLGFGFNFSNSLFFGLEYENLYTSTTGASGTNELDADLPMHSLKLTPGWYPIIESNYKLGIGAGIGIGYLFGNATLSRESYSSIEGDVQAASILLEGRLSFEYSLVSKLWLVTSVGYRHLELEEVEIAGSPLKRDDNNEVVPFDFGGWSIQVGVKWSFPKRDFEEYPDNGI